MDKEPKKFVIIAMARTGSNTLVATLNRSNVCNCSYELFHKEQIPGPCSQMATIAERDADPFAFLEKAQAHMLTQKPKATHFGFKLFFDHNNALMDQLITAPDWQVILLKRPNFLDQFLSLRIAMETQVWNSNEGSRTAKVPLNINAFMTFEQKCKNLYAKAEQKLIANGHPFFELRYEDIAAQNYGELFRFLDMPSMANTNVALKKQNPLRTADKVIDPEAARQALAANGLKHYWVD